MRTDLFGLWRIREFKEACYSRGVKTQAVDLDIDETWGLEDSPTCDVLDLVRALITDEYKELLDAIEYESQDQILKELVDLYYVLGGFAVAFGYDKVLSEAFNRVHANNMDKVANGTVGENGKLIKPAGHPKVNLEDLV